MEKTIAKQIRKAIPFIDSNSVYYNSKKGEYRINVLRSKSASMSDEEKSRFSTEVVRILNAVSATGIRPRFHYDYKCYQGFIHCQYLVFE